MPIKATETSFLAASPLVAWAEFVELTGIREDRIRELMELGWLQPSSQANETPLFRQIDIYKTRTVDRLCEDFELPSLAGAIIVDLLERIEELEKRLKEPSRY